MKALEAFAAILGADADEAPPLSFSLVLIEPMLWTHFEAGPGGLRAQVHVTGPQPDQVVLVSGQDVIHAIANGGLGLGEAYGLGLVRAYGRRKECWLWPEQEIARFVRLARQVG